MQRSIKTEGSPLRPTSLTWAKKTPTLRLPVVDSQKPLIVSFTPQVNAPFLPKWQIRGHKFSTLHTAKKAKPGLDLFLITSSSPENRKQSEKTSIKLPLNRAKRIRPKSQAHTRTGSIYLPPGSSFVSKRRSSSKNLQVDYQDIAEWI
jgi:hypothetical protein